MNLKDFMNDLEKSATEIKVVDPKGDEKPAISAELESLLSKEASASIVSDAFAEGEKLAKSVLEKLAQEALVEKVAADKEDDKKDKKDEGKDKKDDKEEKKDNPFAKKDEDKKDEDKSKDDEKMKKEASDNKSLATKIMEKLAGVDNNEGTVGGVSAAPNKVQQDAALMMSQHDARIQPTPTGTLSQMVDSIVSKAVATGAVAYDQVPANKASDSIASSEGTDPAMGTPGISASQEKIAAVQALIEAGADFDTAVDLIKKAADEIEAEDMEQVKIAAVNELMEQGFNFDAAVQAVNTIIAEDK